MPGNEVNSGNGELDCGISGLAGNGGLRRARELRLQASASGIKSDETLLRLAPGAAFVARLEKHWRPSGAGTSYPDTLPTRAGKQYFDGENPHVSNAGQGAPLLYNSRASSFLTVKIL
jgi:hypothetical protein